MKKIKSEKGITLVMLVVTIIVLLILSGITISAITGGEGSMDKAKKAKDETAIKAEMGELQKIINQSAAKGIRHGNFSGSADSQTIRDALKKNKLIEENPDDVIIDGQNGWKVTGLKTGQKYKIKYDGEVTRIDELAPTKIFAKIEDGILYLRATEQTGYTEGTKWNDISITKVIIEEPIAPTTCEEMFKDCSSIQTIENIENLHTENATSMKSMFSGCSNLKSIDLTNFDTSNVKSMASMFNSCRLLTTINLSNFDTINVTTMSMMFRSCENLQSLNLKFFNTDNVKSMGYMFSYAHELKILDLSNFKTQHLNNSMYMFSSCLKLEKIYVSDNFITDSINNSTYMFYNCFKLTGSSGTTFKTSNPIDKTYAHIDGGSSNPGYFTLKQ